MGGVILISPRDKVFVFLFFFFMLWLWGGVFLGEDYDAQGKVVVKFVDFPLIIFWQRRKSLPGTSPLRPAGSRHFERTSRPVRKFPPGSVSRR